MSEPIFERRIMQKFQKAETDMKSSRIDFTGLSGKSRGVAVMFVACSLARFTARSGRGRSQVHLRFVRSAFNFHTGEITYSNIR